MTGHEYGALIGRYVLANFEERGLRVFREVSIGKTIIGKDRRADLFLVDDRSARAFVIQCKYQDSAGTADEKIPYAIDDLRAMRMPSCLVYGGEGFSMGILHMLRASDMAAYCLPGLTLARTETTWQLDHVLAIQFGWWDIFTDERKRLRLEGAGQAELALPGASASGRAPKAEGSLGDR
jgi:hypothetical protein